MFLRLLGITLAMLISDWDVVVLVGDDVAVPDRPVGMKTS